MTPERYQELKLIFEQALDLTPPQRAAFLDSACGGDIDLRQQVDSLMLANSDTSDSDKLLGKTLTELAPELRLDENMAMLGQRVGPYRLDHLLGQGGMGVVYEASRADDQFRQRVALKLIRARTASELIIRRFQQERQILAGLVHPHIARLLDGGATREGQTYLVMEYVDGQPIDEYCETHGLATRQRVSLFRDVCAAVQYTHQNLVIHRDLKPRNILVTPEGQVKLLDFGIAKLLAQEQGLAEPLTRTNMAVMTPEYASPEQIRGEPVTTISDVYSLGITLYQILVDRYPYAFKSRLLWEIERIICNEDPPKPSVAVTLDRGAHAAASADIPRELRPETRSRELCGDLDNIVLKAISKDPLRRYASAEALSEDLRKYLAGEAVAARAPTLGYRSAKFLMRHRMAAAAALALVLSLTGGIIAASRQALRADRERARAESSLEWANRERVRADAERFRAQNQAREAEVQRSRAEEQTRIANANREIASRHQQEAERQRGRAERRFQDVRKLANSILFDFHNAVEKLPGSTPVRKMLVQRALEYLDRLDRDGGNDHQLQSELAGAYSQVGMLQWARYTAHVGDLEGAWRSHQKARTIREKVVAADPTNRAGVLDLARSHLLIGDVLAEKGDLPGALGSYRRSLKLCGDMPPLTPTDVATRKALAVSYQRIGDTLGNPGFRNLGDTAGALESFRKMQALYETAAAAAPTDQDAQQGVAMGYEKIGKVLDGTGDANGALELFRKELHALEKLAASNPSNEQFMRDVSVAYGNIGTTLYKTGDFSRSVESYREMLAIRERLAAADPANVRAQYDMLRALNVLATTAAKAGYAAEAHSYRSRWLTAFKTLADRPTATAGDLNEFAWALLTCDPAELRNPAEARRYAERASVITDSKDANILDTLAFAYHVTGDPARAVETQERALSLLRTGARDRAEFEARLEKYRAATQAQR